MVRWGIEDRGLGTLTAELLAAPAHVDPVPGTLVCIGGNGRAETLTVASGIAAVGGSGQPPCHAPADHPHPPQVPRPAPLTRRHHTHTARSAAAGAPPRGTGQRAAAAPPRSERGPSRPGGRSPAGMPPWTSQTPPQHPASGTTPHPGFQQLPPSTLPPLSSHPHGTGVWQVPWLWAERTEAPGVGGQFSCGLQDPLAAPKVVTGVSIEVSTQASHPAAELGGQLHQDPGAWTESVAGGLWRRIWGPSSGLGVGRRPAGGGALVAQSCPTLATLMDCSPPGSSVHGMLQARILEWVAMPFSRGSS